jgi:hypothetical protein
MSSAVFLFIALLLLSTAAIVLFVLGLIFKKPSQWIPGLIMGIISIIGGIAAFFYLVFSIADRGDFNNPYRNYSYDYNYNYDYNDNENNTGDTTTVDEQFFSAENTDEQITGFIKDKDNSLINICVIPDPVMKQYGIDLIKINYNGVDKSRKVIPVEMSFADAFKGQLNMTLISDDNSVLGSSSVTISQSGNNTFVVKFIFQNETDFLQARIARIYTSS